MVYLLAISLATDYKCTRLILALLATCTCHDIVQPNTRLDIKGASVKRLANSLL